MDDRERREHIERALETLRLCGYPELVLEIYELIEVELMLGDMARATKLELLLVKLSDDIRGMGIV